MNDSEKKLSEREDYYLEVNTYVVCIPSWIDHTVLSYVASCKVVTSVSMLAMYTTHIYYQSLFLTLFLYFICLGFCSLTVEIMKRFYVQNITINNALCKCLCIYRSVPLCIFVFVCSVTFTDN